MRFRSLFCVLTVVICQTLFGQNELVKKHFDADQAKVANTAKNSDYFSPKEKQFILYLNLCRMNPKEFADFYLEHLKKYDEEGNKKLKKRDRYYYSLLKGLKKQKPLNPVLPSKEMYESALCWAKESGKKGLVGHNRKRCKRIHMAECCSYSFTDDPLRFLLDLLIDEDVRSLGHRKILLDNYHSVGAAIHTHKKYGWCIVVDFSY